MKRVKQGGDDNIVIHPPSSAVVAADNARNKLADHVSIARLPEKDGAGSDNGVDDEADEDMEESDGVDLVALEAARKREQLERYTSSSYVIPSCSSWFELD